MKTKITLLCLLAFLCFIPKSAAQCTTGTHYPIDTYQATNNAGATTINTDAKTGQYANVHIIPEKRYKFSTSVASDYVTVTNSDGSVVYASGPSPVYYISVFNESVRYYIHQNAQCQTSDLFSRSRYLSWVVAPPCLDPTIVGVSNICPNSCTVTLIEPGVAPTFGYDCHVSTSPAEPLLEVETTDSTTNTIFVSNLNPNTTYYYWVRSDCMYQKGDWIYGGSFTTISSLLCNSAYYGLYPAATFTPACTGNDEIFSNDSKNGSYSNIAVTANTQYTFRSDWELDYITITNASGTSVLAGGQGPQIWNSGGTSGVVRFYTHANAQCGLGGVSQGIRSKYVKCTATAVTCLPPTNLAVSNITSNSSRLNWTAPATAPASYDLYITTTNTAPVANTTATATSTTAGIGVLNGLTAATTYYYWIRSNCGTSKSAWASGGNFTTIAALSCNGAINGLYPDAAFTPACSGSAEQIAADSWAGEYSNVNVVANKQYTFTSSVATDYLTVTNAAGTTVLASGLTPLSWASGATSGVIRYHLNTNANCGTQNTSRIRSIKCVDAPATGCGIPTALSVSNITSNSSRLNWTAPATAPASYDLYITTTNTAPVANTTATATSTTAGIGVLNGLTAATTYYYWIRSNCGTSKSAWASGGNFTTIAALSCNGAVNGLYPDAAFTPACSGSAEQIAADSWAGEYSNVNVVANKQYTFTSSVATDYLTVTNAAGTTVLASGLTPLSWASGATSGVIRYHLNTNANCGTQNTSRIRSIKCVDAPVATCAPPSGLAVSNITSNSCRLTWAIVANLPSSYDIYVTTTNTAPAVNTNGAISVASTGLSVYNSLAASTTYYYWVRSVCGSVKSAWVSGGSFTTLAALVCNGAIFGLHPEDTITLQDTGSPEPVAFQALASQYSNINVSANKQYVFTSSIATDYVTVTNAAGTAILASGTTPVTWTSGAASAVVRFYLHANPNCGADDVPRTKFVKSTVLGIGDNIAGSQFKMYPNPSAGQFTVETGDVIADTIAIIDNLGRTISTYKPDSAKATLTINGFSDGIYFVKISYQHKNVTRKLVLKRN